MMNFFLQPAVVGCLVNLKELWMDNNGVRELPPVSSELGNRAGHRVKCSLIEQGW